MCHLNRINRNIYVLTLALGLSPSLLSAQQLSQPASVRPWQSPQAELDSFTENSLAESNVSPSPAWLIDSAKPLSQPLSVQQDLPMVETESFAHLGELNRHSTNRTSNPKDGSDQLNRPSTTKSEKSLRLFRALGVEKNVSDDRR